MLFVFVSTIISLFSPHLPSQRHGQPNPEPPGSCKSRGRKMVPPGFPPLGTCPWVSTQVTPPLQQSGIAGHCGVQHISQRQPFSTSVPCKPLAGSVMCLVNYPKIDGVPWQFGHLVNVPWKKVESHCSKDSDVTSFSHFRKTRMDDSLQTQLQWTCKGLFGHFCHREASTVKSSPWLVRSVLPKMVGHNHWLMSL